MRIEDVIRFVKQIYRLEDVCFLTFHRLQALMALVSAAAHLGLRTKLRVLAAGIRRFLYSQAQGLKKLLELQNPPPIQS